MLRIYCTHTYNKRQREVKERLLSFLLKNKIVFKEIIVAKYIADQTKRIEIGMSFRNLEHILQMTNIEPHHLPLCTYNSPSEDGNIFLGNVEKTIEYFKKRGFYE